jgi:hypothetical protein
MGDNDSYTSWVEALHVLLWRVGRICSLFRLIVPTVCFFGGLFFLLVTFLDHFIEALAFNAFNDWSKWTHVGRKLVWCGLIGACLVLTVLRLLSNNLREIVSVSMGVMVFSCTVDEFFQVFDADTNRSASNSCDAQHNQHYQQQQQQHQHQQQQQHQQHQQQQQTTLLRSMTTLEGCERMLLLVHLASFSFCVWDYLCSERLQLGGYAWGHIFQSTIVLPFVPGTTGTTDTTSGAYYTTSSAYTTTTSTDTIHTATAGTATDASSDTVICTTVTMCLCTVLSIWGMYILSGACKPTQLATVVFTAETVILIILAWENALLSPVLHALQCQLGVGGRGGCWVGGGSGVLGRSRGNGSGGCVSSSCGAGYSGSGSGSCGSGSTCSGGEMLSYPTLTPTHTTPPTTIPTPTPTAIATATATVTPLIWLYLCTLYPHLSYSGLAHVILLITA